MRIYNSRKRILVTGGAGFLGSHLCDRLIEGGHEVICADDGRVVANFIVQALNNKPITICGTMNHGPRASKLLYMTSVQA